MKKTNENEKPLPKGKFKATSRLKGGQKVYFINDGKIQTGVITGYEPAIISQRNYLSNYSRYEVKIDRDTYEMVNDAECYTSQRALLIGIKK